MYRGGGEDQGAPGVVPNRERLVKGPCEGVEVRGVGRGRSSLVSTVREIAPQGLTVAEKPSGRRLLDSRRMRAAISGKVAAIAGASG